MIIRNLLNKIFWDPKESKLDYEVVYIHRGAILDQKHLALSLIKEVKASYFIFESESEGEIIIPFHRIIKIINLRTGETIWRKTKHSKISSKR